MELVCGGEACRRHGVCSQGVGCCTTLAWQACCRVFVCS